MPHQVFYFLFARLPRLVVFVCLGLGLIGAEAEVRETKKISFDAPAGDAPISLKQFAQQAGVELLYSAKNIAGTRTNAVKGVFTPREALAKMLDGTKLVATPGKSRGAVAITRAPDPNG